MICGNKIVILFERIYLYSVKIPNPFGLLFIYLLIGRKTSYIKRMFHTKFDITWLFFVIRQKYWLSFSNPNLNTNY